MGETVSFVRSLKILNHKLTLISKPQSTVRMKVLSLILFFAPLLARGDYSDLESKIELLNQQLNDRNRQLNARIDELTEALNGKACKNESLEERVEELEAQVERLEELAKIHTLRSCSEYAMFGVTKSGFYEVDPDGPLIGNPPFTAYCRFTGGNASTEVTHNHENVTEITASPCEDPLCWNMTLTYDAPMDQIKTLKSLSEFCYQKISFGCFLSGLEANGVPTGVWIDKDGKDQDYFVGANEGSHVCSCGLQSNCSGSNQGYQCNCDNMVPTVQHDRGIITDSTALPILGFKYGLMLYPAQIATINIGRFACMGKKTIDPDDVADSCSTLKTYGVTESGNYILNNQKVVYCDMDKLIDDDDIERYVGELMYKDDFDYNDVRFIASRNNDDGYIGSGKITYEKELIDTSNSFSYSSGIFSAPLSGTYLFSLSATCNDDACVIYTYLNDDRQTDYYFKDYIPGTTDESRQISFEFTMHMYQDDELYLYDPFSEGIATGTSYGPLTFTGRLIQ